MAIDDAKGIAAMFQGLRGPRENVAMNLKRITAACFQARHGPHGIQARALAHDVEHFRKVLAVNRDDPESLDYFIHCAMQIASAFEKLRANELFGKDVRAGRGTSKGGGSTGGDHSMLIEWARQQMDDGLHRRGLAGQAVRERRTTLSVRQARDVLAAAFPNRR